MTPESQSSELVGVDTHAIIHKVFGRMHNNFPPLIMKMLEVNLRLVLEEELHRNGIETTVLDSRRRMAAELLAESIEMILDPRDDFESAVVKAKANLRLLFTIPKKTV